MTMATGVATSFAWLQIGSVRGFPITYSNILAIIDNQSNYPERDYVSVCQRFKVYHYIMSI